MNNDNELKPIKHWDLFAFTVSEILEGDAKEIWINEFAPIVETHIKEYVIPQYFRPNEQGELTSPLDHMERNQAIAMCDFNINKYNVRREDSRRPHELTLDCVKIAHYAQLKSFYKGGDICKDDINIAIHGFNEWLRISEEIKNNEQRIASITRSENNDIVFVKDPDNIENATPFIESIYETFEVSRESSPVEQFNDEQKAIDISE